MTPRGPRIFAQLRIGAVVLLAVCGFSTASDDKSKDPATSPIRDFHERVERYLKLRKQTEAGLPRLKPTDSAQAITARSQELTRKIRFARREARVGSIFTPAAAAEFRRLIALTMQGKEAEQIRASLKSAEPVTLALRVNDPYPAAVPLQSTPPSLLLNLPQVPQQVDYRVIGRALVLRDVDANLILDFIPDAVI
jgi:hypothetical protein